MSLDIVFPCIVQNICGETTQSIKQKSSVNKYTQKIFFQVKFFNRLQIVCQDQNAK